MNIRRQFTDKLIRRSLNASQIVRASVVPYHFKCKQPKKYLYMYINLYYTYSMSRLLALLSAALFCLAGGQRLPKNQPMFFPKEQDIVFPDNKQYNTLFKISDFYYNSKQNTRLELPMPPQRELNPSRFRPGQPFPPPPNGRRYKKRRTGQNRRLCERSEFFSQFSS